jgi:hypothetical protein
MSKPIIICILFILMSCEANPTGSLDSLDRSMTGDASSNLVADAMMSNDQNILEQSKFDQGTEDQGTIDSTLDDRGLVMDQEINTHDIAYDSDMKDQAVMVFDQFTEFLDQTVNLDHDIQQLPDMLIRFEDDPVFTVDAPENLIVPANQSQSYQFPVHFIQLAQSIQAWSFSLIARPIDQCRFTGIDTMGTLAASVDDEPPGLVNQGFTDMQVISTSEGPVALSVVIFSLEQPVLLTPTRIDQPLAQVTLEVNAPNVGQRVVCTLHLASHIPIQNRLIDQVVVWEGQSLPLFFRPMRIEILGE